MGWTLDLLDSVLDFATQALTNAGCPPSNPALSHCPPLGCCVDLAVYLDQFTQPDPFLSVSPYDPSGACCTYAERLTVWAEVRRPWCAGVTMEGNPTAAEVDAATREVLACFDEVRCAWVSGIRSGDLLPTSAAATPCPDPLVFVPPQFLCPEGAIDSPSGICAGWRIGASVPYGATRRP